MTSRAEYMREYRARKKQVDAAEAELEAGGGVLYEVPGAALARIEELEEEVRHLKKLLADRKPQIVPHMPVIVDVGQFGEPKPAPKPGAKKRA